MTKGILRVGVGLAAVVSVLISSAPAGAHYRIDTIYGDDDRKDLHEVTDAQWLRAAEASVALIQSPKVTINEATGMADLEHEIYGEELGLCEEERFAEQPTSAFCSGALIGPDLVLTAGHCVSNDTMCRGTSFVFGFAVRAPGEKPISVAAKDVYSCDRIVTRVLDGHGPDFAVVKLTKAVQDRAPLTLKQATDEPVAGTELVMVGYPQGLPVKIADKARIRDDSTPGYFVATTDSFGGNSGSPVLNAATGEIEGVLVRGDTDFVRAPGRFCRIANRCAENECRGEDVTRASAIRAALQQ